MRIIIVTGMPGAGKEELLSVAGSMGVPFTRMGDAVRDAYPSSQEYTIGLGIGQFAGAERERHGKDIWARRTMERMGGGMFLVDGCRSMEEVASFKGLCGDVVIVGVHSPPEARYERLVRRGRDDAPRSRAEFDERDSREVSWGLAEVIAMADMMIVNDGSLDEFRSASERALRGLR
ncbi:MAG: AAA family ATPase [Methanomassiliicoccaceae archaeon]|nr:AAA family ATPase [Methanomassiliicoccaceae archaeon]